MKATATPYTLQFKRPSGTSRGVMTTKETWFLVLEEGEHYGIGECGILRSLSYDDVPGYEDKLREVCDLINQGETVLSHTLESFPSIRFGLEQALLSLRRENPFILFPSDFTSGMVPIPINGLIWMGDASYMRSQVSEKLDQGFRCLKMKIGAIDFDSEYEILRTLRKEYSADILELRVDANGAFAPEKALPILEKLAELEIHSIEQPIRAGQWEEMARLCENTPLSIALDEELIGVPTAKQEELLSQISPQYIILKPSLIGGFEAGSHWINLAEKRGVGWWVTSALESNIGLNAIAQWTHTLANPMPQGLGTGSLFTNNFESPLEVRKGSLSYRPEMGWQPDIIEKLCT